ncbi:MAG: ATP synthase F1 subunit delta [Cyanobacteria bacterium SIG29]|nr:ATP synthase F1 subunit delta [Cyanobacteria bacterium SIG29]
MNIGDIKNIKIAKKYSNALFEASIEADNIEKIYNELIFVCEIIKTNNQLSTFLNSPLIKISDKKEVLQKLFSSHIDKILVDFLYLIADANRFDAIEEVFSQFSKIYNENRNVVKPLITSAVELSEMQKNNLLTKLEEKLNKKIEPEYVVKSDIIGGLIVEMDDKTIDCSLKTKFDNMKKQLTKGSKYGND